MIVTPRASQWWPRFVWGLTRPFALLLRLRHEPVAYRTWARTVIIQAALTLIVGSVLFVRDLSTTEPVQVRQKQHRQAKRDLQRAVDEARDAGLDLTALQGVLEQQMNDQVGKPGKAKKPPKPETRAAREALGALADAGWPVGLLQLDEAMAQLEDAGVEGDEDARAATDRAEQLTGEVNDAAEAVKEASAELTKAQAEAEFDFWKRLALWASSLVLVQSVLLAFTRDYHDRITRALSLLAGLDPEDEPKQPALRLDLKWLWRKLRRRVRGLLTTGSFVVAFSPIIVVGALFSNTDRVNSLVVGLVSAYWWVVFTGARSARAWRTEADLTPPAPLRALGWATTRVPGLRWFGPRWLLRFAVWGSKSMFAPARAVEQDVPAFVGLALARVVGSIPVIRLALRAALVVAAGELLEATAQPELVERPSVAPEASVEPR